MVYWLQYGPKGTNKVGGGGKLFFGCVANQSDLIKVIQPGLPTTFLASFLLFMQCNQCERKMDERRAGWRGADMEESSRTGMALVFV